MDSINPEILNELKQEFDNIKSSTSTTSTTKSEKTDNKNNETEEEEFDEVEKKLDKILLKINENEPKNYHKILAIITSILYERSKLHLNANRFKTSKKYLEKALNLIKNHTNNPQITFIYLRIINYLSYVISRLGEFERAKNLLETVLNEEIDCEPFIYSTEDLFLTANLNNSNEKNNHKLEKLKINNMQMLGWIYGKLGMSFQYAITIHKSLQTELDVNDGDPINWAIRCFRLGSLFIVQEKWENARYYLTAAQTVLDPLEVNVSPNKTLFKAQADLARVWVNYGLQLFSLSKRSVLEKVWEETEDKQQKQEKEEDESKQNFKFNGIEVILPSVPITLITTNQEARDLFTHTHKWLKRARLFYTLRDFPLQYVNIILELSELYRYLACYERDSDSQYDVHKKRFETLETLSAVMREVRPSCYATVSMEIIREIMDVQLEMMSLNLKKIYNPNFDANLNEDELKKRMDTVNDFNSKIGKFYFKENDGSFVMKKFEGDGEGIKNDL